MDRIVLADKKRSTVFCVEQEAKEGIRRIAGKVIADFNRLTGREETLQILRGELPLPKDGKQAAEGTDTKPLRVLFAGYPDSPFLEKLEKEGRAEVGTLKGKWECYGYWLLPDEEGKLLLVAGSDKRGLIYGMFGLSELMGISPLTYISDSLVPRKEELAICLTNGFVSREPSVRYRGFFINDEWPCFGTWARTHFNGFTAEMYDHVFELLLRLKGNYLWPAMWTSSFALDGPGLAAAELADLYGIVIGNSHHEPCLRASEEWDLVRGEDSIYGNAWNYDINSKGLLKYWEDGLARSGGYESIVTVGMRGERDSKVLGEEATLQDNIDLLKEIIHNQKRLIRKAEQKFGKKLPMLLALYKEVEPYYYGDETTEGLCDWEELSDIILMLCEDNFGYMRTLPDEKMRRHKAGFGMYYHLDYHGAPVSYEWLNSTPLSRIWEQMSMAYDYGVREVWIVNVGDLKFNEFPLSFFMQLAYDYEAYGSSSPGSYRAYTGKILKAQFADTLTGEELQRAEWILTESIRLNALKRPEALNADTYHPCHFGEADRMLAAAVYLEEETKSFLNTLSDKAYEAAYSLFGYGALAISNLLQMQLHAGKNRLYAEQGRKRANEEVKAVTEAIQRDRELQREWALFKDGKWSGMELAAHIGFTKWNEDGCRYPIRHLVEPVGKPRMQISPLHGRQVYDKVYGKPLRMIREDFLDPARTEAVIEVCNTGAGCVNYRIDMPEALWLSCDRQSGSVEGEERVTFTIDRTRMRKEREEAVVSVTDKDTTVEILLKAAAPKLPKEKGVFLPGEYGCFMLAEHFCDSYAPEGFHWQKIEDYGIAGSGMKVYPDTCDFTGSDRPYLTYRFWWEEEKDCLAEFWFAPTNPPKRNGKLYFGYQLNGGEICDSNTVPSGYRAGEYVEYSWCVGVMDHRRICRAALRLKPGINELKLYGRDAGLVAEKILLYEEGKLPASYLGPEESFCT